MKKIHSFFLAAAKDRQKSPHTGLKKPTQALWQQVKTDWKGRCAKANITTVDVGGDYLYIVCTGPQLLSLAKEEELYAALYTVDTVSLKDYAADRVNILK